MSGGRMPGRPTPAFLDIVEVLLYTGSPTGELHGYAIMKLTGRSSARVYPALATLQADGWVTARDGESVPIRAGHRPPPRRLHRLTATGRWSAVAALAAHRPRTLAVLRELVTNPGGAYLHDLIHA